MLNDGIIPALSGVSDNPSSQWAAQLFTMARSGTEDIIVAFEVEQRNYDRVELAVFNCPERGIYAPQVEVHIGRNADLDGSSLQRLITQPLPNTSCDYLLKFCIQFPTRGVPYYNLVFPYQNNSNSIFLGEVTFKDYINDVPCDPSELITIPRVLSSIVTTG